eukprot:CAMPEP_0168511428 /NCGR_PEP_ID=MMETSP0405-20121227/2124_1 /TAXON_ID=498012 /ORGANISM="Trichosphaerium sp, Strain Am-I-7 wt" /LENGTH=361 /DNA_ID=CAMNT_0008529593 /DNA_START=277 /DNA_END=1364 /DNA_ORIENTATION=-
MIFDSADPSSKDLDIGTPNEDFGGPGEGKAGETNSEPRNNVLILSEDGNAAEPNDNGNGGTIKITFGQPITLLSIDVLDIDKENWKIQTFDVDGNKTSSTNAIDLGDNSYQSVAVDVDAVSVRLESLIHALDKKPCFSWLFVLTLFLPLYAYVVADASFAITGLSFICDECPDDCEKVTPGFCGCGQLETDTDEDGTPDCIDECPTDPAKIAPGTCGCGVEDAEASSACDCANQICECFCARGGGICDCAGGRRCISIPSSQPDCGYTVITDVGLFTITTSARKRQATSTEIVINQTGDEFTMDIPSGFTVTKDKVVQTDEVVESGKSNQVSAITASSSTNGDLSLIASLVVIVIAVFFSL